MADIDFLGYSRSKVGSFLLSSDYASLYFANTPGGSSVAAQKAGLVQNCSVAYQHNVQARFETGSSELYWLTGQSLGSLQVGRLVGERGILEGIRYGNQPGNLKKGILGGVEMKLGRSGLEGISLKQDVLVLSGCVLAGIGISFGVGGFDIQESMTIQAAMLKRATPLFG